VESDYNKNKSGFSGISAKIFPTYSSAGPIRKSRLLKVLSAILHNEYSPRRILFILMVSLFISEVVAMLLVKYFGPSLTILQEVLIDALILTLLIFPAIYIFTFRRLLANIAERQEAEIALQKANENLRTLSRSLVEVQENERRTIAHELHDEAGQVLASLMMNLSKIERSADQPQVVLQETADIEHSLITLQENLHRLAMSLRPASLDHLGLVAAIRQSADLAAKKPGLTVQFIANVNDDQLPSDLQTGLYRIIQEALTNVVRHAQATHVDILLNQRGDVLVAMVEDDGIGFDEETIQKENNLGLLGMRERAEMLGGEMSVESGAGKGTTILVEVPYAGSNSSY
jgi:signal transduction histidine kinase